MENNYSNYDMLDKMVANNKKAKSWTAFWMVLLCLMAGTVLWLAYTLSKKNETISEQVQVIQSNEYNLEVKSRIIDSLTENCNDAKSEIVKNCDSVISQTQQTLSSIVNTSAQNGAPIQISVMQQEKLRAATKSINKIKKDLYYLKTDIEKKSTRLFVQFNNKEDAAPLSRFLAVLKAKSEYVVLPPEFVNQPFSTVIKFYNYQNAEEEKILKDLLLKYFEVPGKRITVKYEKNEKIKPTVEVWIGTQSKVTKPEEIKVPPAVDQKNNQLMNPKINQPLDIKKTTPVDAKNTQLTDPKIYQPVLIKKITADTTLKKTN